MKKPYIGVLVAHNKSAGQWAYVPYFGGEENTDRARKRGLEIFHRSFGVEWEITFNDVQEMTAEEYKQSIEGIEL